MSLRRESRKGKRKENENIDLGSILNFIKTIQIFSNLIIIISIIGFFLVSDKTAKTMYTMVIIVNLLTAVVGIIPIKYIKNKSEKLA